MAMLANLRQRLGAAILPKQTRGIVDLVTQNLDDLLPIFEASGINTATAGNAYTGDGAGRKLSEAAAVRGLAGWAYAAVNVFAGAMVGSPIKVQERKVNRKTGKSEWLDTEDHDLCALLEKPNPFLTTEEMLWLATAYILTCGDAYWYIERSTRGRVKALWPLPSQNMRPTFDSADFRVHVTKWTYSLATVTGMVKVEFEPDEIVHFVAPHPKDLRQGFGREQAAAAGVNLAAVVVDAQYWTMTQGAMASAVVMLKEDDEVKRKAWLDAIKLKHEGARKAGEVIGLPMGRAEWKELTNKAPIAFRGLNEEARDLVLGVMGVPQSLTGITRDTSKANVEGAEYIFSKYHFGPLVVIFDARLNHDLVRPNYGRRVRLAHDNPTPKDREAELKELEFRLKNGAPWNEIAAENGWQTYPWGDKWWPPTGVQPVDMVGNGGADSDSSGSSDNGKRQAYLDALADEGRAAGMESSVVEAMLETAVAALADNPNACPQGGFVTDMPKPLLAQKELPAPVAVVAQRADSEGYPRGWTREQRLRISQLADQSREAFRAELNVGIRSYWKQFAKRFLQSWDAHFSDDPEGTIMQGLEWSLLPRSAIGTLAGDVLMGGGWQWSAGGLWLVRQDTEAEIVDKMLAAATDPETAAAELSQLAEPFVARGIVIGGEFQRELYDVALPAFTFESQAAREYASSWTEAYWAGPAQTDQNAIKDVVLRGMVERRTLRQIRGDLEVRFDSWLDPDHGRPANIAVTESTKMWNAGAQAFRDEHEVLYKQWVCSFVNSRDTHISADGQVRGNGQRFHVGADSMSFPGMGGSPKENCHCNCNAVAVPPETGR